MEEYSNLCTTVTLGEWLGNRYIQADRYIQVNLAENIRQLKHFWKLSGDRNIEGDRYI